MSDEPVNLAKARADKHNDGRLWTPLDCLRDTIEEIEKGNWKNVEMVYVAMVRRIDKNTLRYPMNTAGGTRLELMGLLYQHLHDMGE